MIQRGFALPAGALGLLLSSLLTTGAAPVPGSSEVTFLDVTEAAGISFEHKNSPTPEKNLVETMGSGCGFVDFDNDGYLDIFLVNGGRTPGSKQIGPFDHALYRNQRDGTFQLATAAAKIEPNKYYGMGVAVGDFDNDGFDDLFITNFNGPDVLYRNNGDGTFTNVAEMAGVAGDGSWSTSATFLDYDNDGLLDLYVVRYVDHTFEKNLYCGARNIRAYCTPQAYLGVSDLLYRNQGDGTFADISKAAGVALSEGKGLGVSIFDYDQDGYVDIYVANDSVRNFLFYNNQDGSFLDRGLTSGTGWSDQGEPQGSMGTSVGDYDGDGRPDIAVTNFHDEYLALYRNLGDGFFEDVSTQLGVKLISRAFVGFGIGFLDFDNDSDLDLLVANGHVLDNAPIMREGTTYRQRKLLLENAEGRFHDAKESGEALAAPQVSRGLALGDYDNDGDVDALVANCGGPAVLLRNENGNRSSWLQLKLIGNESNRNAFGARVELRLGAGVVSRQVTASGSYLSSSDHRVHFGLGSHETAVSLTIFWPSGRRTDLKGIRPRQQLVVEEGR